MPWYRTGTVNVTTNSNAVIGTGTAFIANSRVGDAFLGPDGAWYEVTNIASNTALSITPNYKGTSAGAGSYSIAPLQGYVKESADRLRQTVDNVGATLALFGGATDVAALRSNIGAAKNGVNSDITAIQGLTSALSIAQGGTGGATAAQARTGLGLKAAALSDVLGGVSQAGGVPTGAIFQKGSSANGDFTLFASGLGICTYLQASVVATANTNMTFTWSFPAVFSNSPFAGAWVRGGNSNDTFTLNRLTVAPSSGSSATVVGNFSVGQTYFISLVAIGNWFV